MYEDFPWEPLYDTMIVKPDPEEDRIGGIILPEQSQKKLYTGTIIATGKGHKLNNSTTLMPLQVKPGDRVRFDLYAGEAVMIDGEKYLYMRELGIVAILHEKEKDI